MTHIEQLRSVIEREQTHYGHHSTVNAAIMELHERLTAVEQALRLMQAGASIGAAYRPPTPPPSLEQSGKEAGVDPNEFHLRVREYRKESGTE